MEGKQGQTTFGWNLTGSQTLTERDGWLGEGKESHPGQISGCINLHLLPYICTEPSPCKTTEMLEECVCSIGTSQVLGTCSAATWEAAAAATGAAPTADFRAAQAMLIDI